MKVLQQKTGFCAYQGASTTQITQAEQVLVLTFAKDYTEMLAQFGIVSFGEHEFTGLCPFPRLNVVDVTREERSCNPTVPQNLYVIEQVNIDGIVIWQSETGTVYQSIPNGTICKIADSLSDYCELT